MSFNQSAYDGARLLAQDVGGTILDEPGADYGEALEIRLLESVHQGEDREQLLRSLAEDGRTLVFAVGFLFAESMAKVARDYPACHFVLIDGTVPDLGPDSNLTCVSFAEHEGSFLVGACAGLVAAAAGEDARAGFVGGMDMPLIRRFLAGYEAGVAWTAPALRGDVPAAFVGKDSSAFNDPAKAAALATAMYGTGTVIVFQAAGGSGRGVFEAAARAGKLAIGVDSDQAAAFRASEDPAQAALAVCIVTSMLKRVDRVVYAFGREALSGAPIKGGYRTFGLAEGGIGYAAGGMPPDAVALLDELSRRIVSGDIVVPDDEAEARAFIEALP